MLGDMSVADPNLEERFVAPQTGGRISGPSCLAPKLEAIEALLECAPGRIRYRPLRRALWRALLLSAVEVRWLRANPPASLGPLDLIALALVDRACAGNMKASKLVLDQIEGRPHRRADARPPAGIRLSTIEAIVHSLYDLAAGCSPGWRSADDRDAAFDGQAVGRRFYKADGSDSPEVRGISWA